MITRRQVLTTLTAVAASSCARSSAPPPKVSIRRIPHYSAEMAKEMIAILQEHRVAVKGRRVVLKPNLVEFDPATTINTNPAFVFAAYEAFRSLGAQNVSIAEGPGHRRATLDMAEAAGYFTTIPDFETSFTDLNLDNVHQRGIVKPQSKLTSLYLPETILDCDLLVSLPKLKTHHWVGATLSMKNFFGIVPGAVYGWPKNVLHWAGVHEAITDIHSLLPPHFAFVDGIVGMEGNGPVQGTPKHAGVLVAGSDLPAVDATCCRIMGLDPSRIDYLQRSSTRGQTDAGHVQQIGETIASVQTNFQVLPALAGLRLT